MICDVLWLLFLEIVTAKAQCRLSVTYRKKLRVTVKGSKETLLNLPYQARVHFVLVWIAQRKLLLSKNVYISLHFCSFPKSRQPFTMPLGETCFGQMNFRNKGVCVRVCLCCLSAGTARHHQREIKLI